MARQEQSAMEKTGAGIKQTQLGWALQHSGAFLQKEAFRNEKKPEMNESQQSSPTARGLFQDEAGICKKAKCSHLASLLKDLMASYCPQVSSG